MNWTIKGGLLSEGCGWRGSVLLNKRWSCSAYLKIGRFLQHSSALYNSLIPLLIDPSQNLCHNQSVKSISISCVTEINSRGGMKNRACMSSHHSGSNLQATDQVSMYCKAPFQLIYPNGIPLNHPTMIPVGQLSHL